MSTTANIIIRNARTLKKETVLYRHSDAHPNSMTLLLAEMLRDTYEDFRDLGDMDWFLSPSKLAAYLIIKSVPQMTEDMKKLLKTMPETFKSQLDSAYFLGMPTFLPESVRVPHCNYEYIVTLSEDVEEKFFGYEITVNKLTGNKVVSTVLEHKENLVKVTPTKKVKESIQKDVPVSKV